MGTATAPTEERRRELQERVHPQCMACRDVEAGGLGLEFHVRSDGSVAADWFCPPGCQSYTGLLHGGLSATLLDDAMVHALFARGLIATTAELRVRYRHPVRVAEAVQIVARLRAGHGPLYVLRAELRQAGRLCVHAEGKFMAGAE